MPRTSIVTEELLDSQADFAHSRGLLPEIILRLILASDVQPTVLRVPTQGSVGQPGWDAELDTATGFDSFIPVGPSFWEMSCARDPEATATENFNKRTAQTDLSVQEKSTFIFVTPRSAMRGWNSESQKAWAAKCKSETKWKDVRVIAGTELYEWLLLFPAISFWLAKEFGVPTGGLEIPSEHWENLRSHGHPPLPPEAFLINRNDVREKLRALFNGEIFELIFQAKYPEYSVDVVAAFLASLEKNESLAFAGKCLIIGDDDTWKNLATRMPPHVFVALPSLDIEFTNASLRAAARRHGHRVIFTATRSSEERSNSVRLNDPKPYELAQILEKAGYTEERARALTAKSGGCLSTFKRLLLDVTGIPEWGQNTVAADLYIANLIGRWDGNNPNDQKAVELCLGNAYGGWIKKILPLTVQKNPPISQRNEKWKFISRYEAWRVLGSYVQSIDLDRFSKVAIEVLQEISPALELAPDQRWMANVHGKSPKYSESIREGIAETLVLLNAYPQSLQSCPLDKVKATADLIVRATLAKADWKLWASLIDVMPLLAEASPDEFLNAIIRDLGSDTPEIYKLYDQESDAFTGRNYFTGILWALELLAWNQNYLARVALILAELASDDPGGKWSNRPINSLVSIFLPWHVQTCATATEREAIISKILSRFPETGWTLLLRLLPSSHEATSGTYKPAFREWIPDNYEPNVGHDEYVAQVDVLTTLALNFAADRKEKLPILIERLDSFPPAVFNTFLDLLSSSSIQSIGDEEKFTIWKALNEFISKHRKFPDADWAISEEHLSRIDAVANNLEPSSPSWKHRRIFDDDDYNLVDPKLDYDAGATVLAKQRLDTVSELFASGGLDEILKFYKKVGHPWQVGFSFSQIATETEDSALLPTYLRLNDEATVRFISGYIFGRFSHKGYPWATSIIASSWNLKEKFFVLTTLPFKRSTWILAEQTLGAEIPIYWTDVRVNPHQIDAPDLPDAIQRLINTKRFVDALRCLGRAVYDKIKISPILAISVLEGYVNAENKGGGAMDAHYCTETIKTLQENPETDIEKLRAIEWSYLPLLDGHRGGARPKSLELAIATDPDFFCKLITTVFRSRSAPKREEPTDSGKKIIENAYRLLREWSIIPGQRDDGSVDKEALTAWLKMVITSTTASGHLEVALSHVGQVLSHARPDPDGLWISRPVAEVLNASDMEAARNGFRVAKFNSRGVVMGTKGKGERELASRYNQQATDIEIDYPNLSATMRELAKSYERYAEREEASDPFED
ncbi:MAG TPA: hypothetical protein VHC95_13240 [Opitutales bacterium]|nr:hypothetical protein [Opitutales bacterium]